VLARYIAIFVLAVLAAAGPVSTAADAGAGNPLRDYVKARLAAKNSQAWPGTPGPSPRIVGGTEELPGGHRFQVALLFAGSGNNAQAFYCGGSVYRGQFVITAAHCSDFVTPRDVRVLAGTQRLDGSGKRYGVKSIRVHPKWDPITFDYDIAVWTLSEKVPDMPVLRLAKSDPPVGTMLKVTGWGSLIDGADYPIHLQRVQVPLTGRANCNDANSFNGAISARMLCAGYDAGGKDSCYGDSGGPLTRPYPQGGRVLTGIVSWGTGCALPNLFGVYTRVSNWEIRNFIAKSTWPWPLQ